MLLSRRGWLKSATVASTMPLTLWGQSPAQPLPPAKSSDTKRFGSKRIKCDIVVAGGGLAGVCAALAAARNGMQAVLIQDRSRLGGNSSSEIRMHVLGANSHAPLQRWRETGLIEELKLQDAAFNQQRSFEMWDLLLYDKVISESNITLLLDTSVTNARVKNGKLQEIAAVSSLLETQFAIQAQY
jgi:NADPH-dependent 2,4-dienoyl-CoA reductase/sulfur reductase-like enzyme